MVDEIPYTPPGAPAAPVSITPATTSAPTPTAVPQGTVTPAAPTAIGSSAATPVVPDAIDPGAPQSTPPATASVEPLPPDYEEFRVSATFNGIDEVNTNRYWALAASRSTFDNVYAMYNDDGGIGIPFSGTDAAIWSYIVNKDSCSGMFCTKLSLTCLTPFSNPDTLYVVVGMRTPLEYNMPYNATGLASAVDQNALARPTLLPYQLGLQRHISELNFLNCRLDGSWDLRGHSALIALRFYGCPSWHKVRLPEVHGLEVSIDEVSATCDILPSETGPYWQTFFGRLPDLSGAVGGVIVGPTDLGLVAMIQPIWAASGATAKNWALV